MKFGLNARARDHVTSDVCYDLLVGPLSSCPNSQFYWILPKDGISALHYATICVVILLSYWRLLQTSEKALHLPVDPAGLGL